MLKSLFILSTTIKPISPINRSQSQFDEDQLQQRFPKFYGRYRPCDLCLALCECRNLSVSVTIVKQGNYKDLYGKNISYFNFKIRTSFQFKKNSHLNSSVCLLVSYVVFGVI